MPKLSLKRRHRRQHDLCLLRDASPVESRLNRETASRMVSDDDIKYSPSSDEPSSSTESSSSPSPVPTKAIPRMSKVESLKLPPSQVSECCVHSSSSQKTMIGSSFLPCVSPTNHNESQTKLSSSSSSRLLLSDESSASSSRKRSHTSVSASSPWGQFVDMVIPASPSDDCLVSTAQRMSQQQPATKQRRFLPSCPSPEPHQELSPSSSSKNPLSYHPYDCVRPSRSLRRQRIRSPSAPDKVLKGFVLHVPNERVMIEEAESALKGLSF